MIVCEGTIGREGGQSDIRGRSDIGGHSRHQGIGDQTIGTSCQSPSFKHLIIAKNIDFQVQIVVK